MRFSATSSLRAVPWRYRQWARRVCYWPLDVSDSLRGRVDPYVPPRGLNFVGGGDYREVGLDAFRLFSRHWPLRAQDNILDIGCGIGRMALPFITELQLSGAYHGFDIVPAGIRWANRHIAHRHPNFHFHWAPVHNERYNPAGTVSAGAYRFPFADASFDFAFATSVFTHMWLSEVCHYLAEARRVLRVGAGAVFTFFIVDEVARRQRTSGQEGWFTFSSEQDGTWVASGEDSLLATGFAEADLVASLEEARLPLAHAIEYGNWRRVSSPNCEQFQDVITVRAC